MTTLKRITVTLLAATALSVTTYVSAQTDDGTAAASPQPSKKAVHARNHQLEKAVRHALTRTKNLDSAGITVLAKGGVVTLEGTVPANDQIQIASDAAGAVSGVSTVKNNLSMREAGN